MTQVHYRDELQSSLGDRASSKLTLEDELYDILYAFGLVGLIFILSRKIMRS